MEHSSPTDGQHVAEAIDIVQQMKDANIPTRIMAGCAVRIHCDKYAQLHEVRMQRHIRDIDFVTLGKNKKQLTSLLERLGYRPQLAKFQLDRDIFTNPGRGISLDIFYDKLIMCHTVEYTDRLENDFPTVALADLVLQKLQIIELNERDVTDLVVLFLEHEVGGNDNETINGKYIANLLSNDWGFYYTATENIRKTNKLASKYYRELLSPQEAELLEIRTCQLLSMIESEPKSLKWRMRQKIGTKMIWYNEVEERERGTLAEYLTNKEKVRQA